MTKHHENVLKAFTLGSKPPLNLTEAERDQIYELIKMIEQKNENGLLTQAK